MARQPLATDLFDLPPDMIRLILSHLDTPDLAAVGSTCNAGRAAAFEDDLWAGVAVRLAGRVALDRGRPPASSADAARAERVGGALAAWAPAGISSYRDLVLGLLHPCAWALATPCAIPATCCALGGLACPRLALPGSEGAGARGGLLLDLRTPTCLGRGLDRLPLLRVEPGVGPSDAHPGGTPPPALCLRVGRPTPGVVPMPGAHPARLRLDRREGAPPIASFTCDGGCVTALTLTQGRVVAAVRTADPAVVGDVGPGGARAPPLRPGLPDFGSRLGDLPGLMRAMGGLDMNTSNAAVGASRVELRPLGPAWAGGTGGPPPPSLKAYPARLAGLWKGCYGVHGPELLAIAPPGPGDLGGGPWNRAAFLHPQLAAVKVSGDANVPAGEASFVAYAAADADEAVAAAGATGRDTTGSGPGPALACWDELTGRPTRAGPRRAPLQGARPVPLADFLGWRAGGAGAGIGLEDTLTDPPSTATGAAAADWGRLRIVATHPAHGVHAAPGFTDPVQVGCLLLELAGWEGEAFVVLWNQTDPDGAGPPCTLFVRVHENEVMG